MILDVWWFIFKTTFWDESMLSSMTWLFDNMLVVQYGGIITDYPPLSGPLMAAIFLARNLHSVRGFSSHLGLPEGKSLKVTINHYKSLVKITKNYYKSL